jgi:hypothetical protein
MNSSICTTGSISGRKSQKITDSISLCEKGDSHARDTYHYHIDFVVGGFLRLGEERARKKSWQMGRRQLDPCLAGDCSDPVAGQAFTMK